MASFTYPRGRAMFCGSANWESSKQTFQVALVNRLYRPKPEHTQVSDVSPHELSSGGGYKRQTITGREVVVSGTRAECFAAPVTFRGLHTEESYRWAVVFRQRTSGASDLVCAIDMGVVPLKGTEQHQVRWDGQEKSGRIFSIS